MDGLLYWICAPQSLLALLGLDLCPSISFCTPSSLSVLPLLSLHTASDTPPFMGAHLIFPRIHHIVFQTPFWFTASYLQFQPFRYLKLSQTRLEFNFIQLPGLNLSETQGAPPASLCLWWTECSCICSPHMIGDLVDSIETMFDWYHSDHLLRVLFRFYLHSFWNHSPFSLVLLSVAMQTIEYW
jgi:hypothetical protein